MSNLQPLNIANFFAYLANAILVNYIGASGKYPSNAEISGKYQTLVTPAGYAFAIWGIIFLAQLIWSVLQLLPSYRQNDLVTKGAGYYYVCVCVAQILWTFLFTAELISLSLVAMIGILIPLFMIVSSQDKQQEQSHQDLNGVSSFWLLKFPFEIHFAWIIAASLVNYNVVLVALNVPTKGQLVSAWVSLIVLALVAIGYLVKRNYVAPLVLSWASYGISVELKNPRESIAAVFPTSTISMLQKASQGIAIAIFIATILIYIYNKVNDRRRRPPSTSSDYQPITTDE